MQYNNLKDFCTKLSHFVVGTEGNLSLRVADTFIIKKSGTSFDDVSFISCDINGKPINSYDKPSMEVSFHSFIYKNSDYNVIAHTHPINVLKILCADNNIINKFANNRLFPDQVVFNGASACIVPYVTPGNNLTFAIKEAVQNYKTFPNLLLLKNHGIICCAHSIKHAIIMTEICEKSAEIFLNCPSLDFLTEQHIFEIQNHADELYRKNI